MGWEFELLETLQNIHNPWLDQAMIAITSLADHGILWLILGLLFLIFSKTRHLGLSLLLSVFLGYVTGNGILKNLIARKRPCWIKSEIPLLIPIPRDYSFPSGHTLVSFEGAFSIWKYNQKWGFAALVVASLIGCSRLYLFVHFPTDVLAGIALAMINAWAGDKIAIWIETNFQRVMKGYNKK